jgi:hypothetical protein
LFLNILYLDETKENVLLHISMAKAVMWMCHKTNIIWTLPVWLLPPPPTIFCSIFYVHSQSWKASISLIMYVPLQGLTRLPPDGCSRNLILEAFIKIYRENPLFLKSEILGTLSEDPSVYCITDSNLKPPQNRFQDRCSWALRITEQA